MISCADVELELTTAAEPSAALTAHLAGCQRCRELQAEAAQVLSLAALPELSATERAKLSTLPVTTHSVWRRQTGRRAAFSSVLRLAIAAGVGALITSGVLWTVRPVRTVMVEQPAAGAAFSDGSLALLESTWGLEEPNLSDDEVSYEVSWPSDPEGDTP